MHENIHAKTLCLLILLAPLAPPKARAADPKGGFSIADCVGSRGWACDPDNYAKSLEIKLFVDGPAGTGVLLDGGPFKADVYNPMVAQQCNQGAYHAFDIATPAGLKDGKAHAVYAYAVDNTGSGKVLLSGSPKTIACRPPDATPPAIIITAPKNGEAVSGLVEVSATAGDNVGVTKVEFLIDGVLKATGAIPPYQYSWDTAGLAGGGAHTVKAKAYDGAGNSGESLVEVTIQAAAMACDQYPAGTFFGCYYDNITGASPNVAIDASSLKFTRNDPAVLDFEWKNGTPDARIAPDAFAVKWQGKFDFESAEYEFAVTADDGIRLYVDDALLIDQWRDQAVSYVAVKTLSGGGHRVRVEYYDNAGGATAKVYWSKVLSSWWSSPISAQDMGVVTYQAHRGDWWQEDPRLRGYKAAGITHYFPDGTSDNTRASAFMGWYKSCADHYNEILGAVAGPYSTDPNVNAKVASVAAVPKTCGAGCGSGMKVEVYDGIWRNELAPAGSPLRHWIAFYELGRGTPFPFYGRGELKDGDLWTKSLPAYMSIRCGRKLGGDVEPYPIYRDFYFAETRAYKNHPEISLTDLYDAFYANREVVLDDEETSAIGVTATMLDDMHTRYGLSKMAGFFQELAATQPAATIENAQCNIFTAMSAQAVLGKDEAAIFAADWKLAACPQAAVAAFSVSITSPAAGDTVKGIVPVLAVATGDTAQAAWIELQVDGKVTATDTSSPYTYNWNTTGLADGPHTLKAAAYDAATKLLAVSAEVAVTVGNAAAGGAALPPFGVIGFPVEQAAARSAIKDIGAGLVRINASWDELEPVHGAYRFALLEDKLKPYWDDKIETLVNLRSYSSWGSNCAAPFDPLKAGCPPKSAQEYAGFMRDFAAYFNGRVRFLQIDNEISDHGLYWAADAKEYLPTLNAAYAAAKSGSASIQVVLAGLASETLELILGGDSAIAAEVEGVMKNGSYDLADVHLYHDYRKMKAKIDWAAARTSKPLISTETGGVDPRSEEPSPAKQAQEVAKRVCLGLGNGLKAVTWFSLFDLTKEASAFSDMGLIDVQPVALSTSAKPSYYTYQLTAGKIGGFDSARMTSMGQCRFGFGANAKHLLWSESGSETIEIPLPGLYALVTHVVESTTTSTSPRQEVLPVVNGVARLSLSGSPVFVEGATATDCDLNRDGATNVVDVQLQVNQALGAAACASDLNRDGSCNVIDIQRVVNADLGGQCVLGP
ncbi:MAG: hypothetical protein A2X37_07800 [Elusimicrobia bacterium GWA2_66_18]|nr:MAG: hypothetical protein A2X37_07800 [Elusimicrobia bacterium GWA2_66_18]